jgi:hypothetical protein
MAAKRTTAGLIRYVVKVSDAMGFDGWIFHIKDDQPEDWDNRAEITVLHACREAWIDFRCDWKSATPEELREVVVHELAHCWTNTAFYPIRQLEPVLSDSVYQVAVKATGQWIEQANDRIGKCIAPHMPLY